MSIFLVFMRVLWYTYSMKNNTKNEETITISKAEYESLKQQIAFLMEQLKLSKHRKFGSSSEQTGDQMSLFNEAEQIRLRLNRKYPRSRRITASVLA